MMVHVMLAALLLPLFQDAQGVQRASRTFDEATTLLNEGFYEEALTRYEAVQSMGVSSAALWHNMGIAHYRLNHLGWAILYFERASRLNANNEAVLHSLRVARERQIDSFSSLPRPFWRTVQAAVLEMVSQRAWFMLGLGFLYGGLALFLLQRYTRVTIPLGSSIHTGLPMLGGICVLIALTSSLSPPHREAAVIVASEVTLVEQADPAAPVIAVVHEGLAVDVRTRTPEWVLVELSNGTQGWVPNESLESI